MNNKTVLTIRHKIIFVLIVLFVSFILTNQVVMAMDKYDPGSNIVIGDFVFDDNYVATTTANCTVFIYDPSGTDTIIASSVPMTSLPSGWTYYSTSTLFTEGVYPTTMTCGSVADGDLASLDKTFSVGYTSASTTLISNAVWNNPATSSIATVVNAHTDQVINTASTSIVASVNANTNAVVTAASSSLATSLPGLIWNYAGDISNILSQITYGVWNYAGAGARALTSAILGNTGINLATQSDVTNASSSLASTINAHTDQALNTASSSIVTSVNANTVAAVTTASSSLAAVINAGVASTTANLAINNAIIKSLNDTNAVWDYLGQVLHSGQSGTWATSLSDTDTIVAGNTLRAKVYVTNQWNAADAYAVPVIRVLDETHGADPFLATTSAMTRIGTGIYEFVYTVPSNASLGTWETIVDTQVQVGQTIENSDYWTVQSALSPPMVAMDIFKNIVPNIIASTTIKNEGTAPDEYQYEWCVVSSVSGSCEDGTAVSYGGLTAQQLQPNQVIHPFLTSPVSVPGNYYFKLVVYYNHGDHESHAIVPFTAVASSVNPPVVNPPSGVGGGGGGSAPSVPTTPTIINDKYKSADFNQDSKVNSIDFSILLYFWKTKAPFANKFVDINKDGKVDSVDFSILLYQWDKK